MRLWLVRHGPTHAKAMVGWTDIPADLSDTAAIKRLRGYLPDAPVVSSDLIRASATADALAPKTRLPDNFSLRETNFGDWEMQTYAEVEASDPAAIRAYLEASGDIAPPGGESWNTLRTRVDAAIDGYLTQNHSDLIVVAHFGVILTQVQRALGIDTHTVFGQKIDNLSVTQLCFGSGWHAGPINHAP